MSGVFFKMVGMVRNQGLMVLMKKVLSRLAYYLNPKAALYKRTVQKILNEKNVARRFQIIYEKNMWESNESVSGHGSTLQYTENIRKKLPELFKKNDIHSLFDAPCGDFNWMRHVLEDCPDIEYRGGDIVPEIIQANQSRYASDRITFQPFDITIDPIPDCDLMMVRDCLIHLSYEDISRFLENFSKSDVKYLLTTTYLESDSFENTNIKSGNFRRIDLFSSPFFFPDNKLEALDDWIPPHSPRQLVLFEHKDVPSSIRPGNSI